MISVIILGTGNVANHLIKAFIEAKEIDLIQIYGRDITSLEKHIINVNTTSNLDQLKEADIYVIAITDDAISEFSSHLKLNNKLVVHTSGSVAMNALRTSAKKGVFYPLQTFSKNKPVNFKEIPICIEVEKTENYELLEKLARSISNKVYAINSHQRKYIHLAAVFINNFTNYMYKIGSDICLENGIPFEMLHPLLLETAQKVTQASPDKTQTGPAVRNDSKTIEAQLDLLKEPEKEIYKLLTQSILNTYGKKL